MSYVALLLLATAVLYCGFFYLLALVLQMGIPTDALWAGAHRIWLGGAATLVLLVVYIFMRFADVEVGTNRTVGLVLLWILRAAIWVWVSTRVYRVTRWRKGKLAISVAAGLALNAGIDFALHKLGASFMPSFGSWDFRLC